MNKHALKKKTDTAADSIKSVMLTMYNALNSGQKKKILKNEAVAELFQKYGVNTEE